MKRILANVFIVILSFLTMTGAVYATFEETVAVAGASFTVIADDGNDGMLGDNTDLKILVDTSAIAEGSNLDDQVPGPVFDSVTKEWTEDYPLKLYNHGTRTLDIVSKASYVSDTDVLRDDIYVEVFAWDDVNGNGVVDSDEIGESYGRDTILRWRNDTFPLGQIGPGEVKGFVLRFDGQGITDINTGMQAVYDFLFIGVEST